MHLDFSLTFRIQSVFYITFVSRHSGNSLTQGAQTVRCNVCVVFCVTPLLTSTPCVRPPDVSTTRGPPLDTNGTSSVIGARRKHLHVTHYPGTITTTPTSTYSGSRGNRPPDDPSAAKPGTAATTAPDNPSRSNFTRKGRAVVPRSRTPEEPRRMGESQTLESRNP